MTGWLNDNNKGVSVNPKLLIYPSSTPFPFGNHKLVCYVCGSPSVLDISSFVSFFWFHIYATSYNICLWLTALSRIIYLKVPVALFSKFILCIYWVFIAVCRLSLGAVSRLLTAVASSLIAKHRLQGVRASVVVHRLSCPRYVGSFQTRDRTPVPCLGRQIVNHWNSREAFPVGS